ncbi:uncharacterized protein LOC119324747 [Triticum dicoccoides]|uniref:uncharacterized protein LOC119324747 n=1 Tax=Triticum dicoccoides TaxID=85692 RepID=UPI0018912983|nr:uncharacterized protein LOC119324747 [Triticum dicoccoides]
MPPHSYGSKPKYLTAVAATDHTTRYPPVMAPATSSCAVLRFVADEAALPETLHVVRLQRLRLRRAAEGCLDPIAEEEEYAGTSSTSGGQDDDDAPACSPSAHGGSSGAVDLAQCRRR